MRLRHLYALTLIFLWMMSLQSVHASQPFESSYLTRAATVELLLRASRESIPDLSQEAVHYPDVIASQTHSKYILYATTLGMIDPEPKRGLLFPYRSVSRAEFLKMMAIAFNLPQFIPHTFQDIENNSWYAPYAGLASYYHIFEDAIGTHQLQPAMRVTPEEAERALRRFFLIEPDRMPRNFSFTAEEEKPTGIRATPQLVKNAIIKLFQRDNVVSPDTTRQEVIALVNEKRAEEKLPSLTENILLRISAQKHAKDMYQRGYFSHITPEGADYVDRIRETNYLDVDQSKCGCKTVFNLRSLIETNRKETTPSSMTSQTKVCGCRPRFSVGENIAKGQLTSKQVMEDWTNSPPHRANILHPQFEEIGIGLFGDIWVQNFGRMQIE